LKYKLLSYSEDAGEWKCQCGLLLSRVYS